LYKEIKKQIKLTSAALNLDDAGWNQAVYTWIPNLIGIGRFKKLNHIAIYYLVKCNCLFWLGLVGNDDQRQCNRSRK
jgi:hypothetical protein